MQKNNNINFVFFGTPDVAKETLQILKEHDFIPSLIVTSPDKPQGRKMILTSPPAKTWAIENNISYVQPDKLNKEEFKKNYDLFIVVAYGKIIPKDILEISKFGSINIHYSLLTKYRGASPVESAILNDDQETGVSIQKMEYKMDTGPILSQKEVFIDPDETASELRKRLIKIGGELLVKTLPGIISRKIKPIPQKESNATYSKKIKKEDGLIDLNDEAIKNYNKFRAYAYWPRTFFFRNGKRVIISESSLENGNFTIKKVIPEGKKEISYEEWKKNN